MAKTRDSKKKMSTTKKLAIGAGTAAALGAGGYGAYKLKKAYGPSIAGKVQKIRANRKEKKITKGYDEFLKRAAQKSPQAK